MHNDFDELEAELKRLCPREVSSAWLTRIDQELDSATISSASEPYKAATNWRSWKWVVWSTAIATALMVSLLYFWPNENHGRARPLAAAVAIPGATSSTEVAEIYKPVRADNVLAGEQEERITLPDGTPARCYRAQYVDTITWTNPQTNASLRWSVPREEVRVVPVSFQ